MGFVRFRVMGPLVRATAYAALVVGASAAAPAADAPAGVVVLKAARLFDGRTDAEVRDGMVVVEGGTIKAVGAGLAVPPGARVIDLGDATLLPGFIDAHTHVTGESSDNWLSDTVSGLRRNVPESAIRATEFARRTLMAGFTTIRDVGSSDYVDVALRHAARFPKVLAVKRSLPAQSLWVGPDLCFAAADSGVQ